MLAYEGPWWQYTKIPNAESGRLFTDLPMRQIYYFGPRWLAENKWTDTPSNISLVMVYNDSHYEAFWRTFQVHSQVYKRPGEMLEKMLGERLEKIGDRPFKFWSTNKFKKCFAPSNFEALKADEKAQYLSAIDMSDIVDERELRHRMEEKIRKQLSEIHGYDVPMAIGGMFHDWSEEGGWHTWEPFVDVPAVKDVILQPFEWRDGVISVRKLPEGENEKPEQSRKLPLFVCGEAFAWEQGWIEGALMTAERVAAEVVTGIIAYEVPRWFNNGKVKEFVEYMYAELSKGLRESLNRTTPPGS